MLGYIGVRVGSFTSSFDAIGAIPASNLFQTKPLECPANLSLSSEVLIPVSKRIMCVEQGPFALQVLAESRVSVIITEYWRDAAQQL